MSRARKWRVPAISCLALALSAALLGSPYLGCRRVKESAEPPRVLKGHRFPITTMAFAADGSRLTSVAYYRGTLQMEVIDWEVATARPTAQRSLTCDNVHSLVIAPDGRTLVSGENQTVALWDKDARNERRLLGSHPYLVLEMALSADGRRLATADALHVALWDIASGQRLVSPKEIGPPSSLAIAPDNRTLAIGGKGTIQWWDMDTGKRHGVGRGEADVIVLAFSPSGTSLASGDRWGGIRLWDLASRTDRSLRAASSPTRADNTLSDPVVAMTYSPDGRTLAAAVGPIVRLYDVASGEPLACLEGHTAYVSCLAFTPDGSRLASGSYDRTVRFWDMVRYRASSP